MRDEKNSNGYRNSFGSERSENANNNKYEQRQSFANVVGDIPKQMPIEIANNVSVPLCFVCLLHLANEKNLEINQDNGGGMSDLLVSFNNNENSFF